MNSRAAMEILVAALIFKFSSNNKWGDFSNAAEMKSIGPGKNNAGLRGE